MELEPVAIRSGVCSPCRFESYTLRLWNIYIKRKTRNLTRIPIFTMIEGVRMCEFCKSGKRGIILNDDGSIICLTADTVVAIDRDTGKKHKNQIAINYCPICGRKLVE